MMRVQLPIEPTGMDVVCFRPSKRWIFLTSLQGCIHGVSEIKRIHSMLLVCLFLWLPLSQAVTLKPVQGNFNHKECINCHRKTDAQLVNDWQHSAHATQQPQALCTNCHGNDHAGAAARSRRNDACVECHGGATSPVVHSYTSSKHGILMQLEQNNYDWTKPLRTANYRAPGCSYCHMHSGNHATGKTEKLKPDMDRISAVCADCHGPRYIARLNDNALRMQNIADMKLHEAQKLADEFSDSENPELDHALHSMQKHVRNVYLGAFHQSPDYQWWHGQPALDGDLLRIKGLIDTHGINSK
jgi:hypothetical protein